MRNKLQEEISSFLTKHAAAHYFIAVSGGMDSMLLLDLVSECSTNLTVLHVNYQLRGADSEADQAFVETYCQSKGIPCIVHRIRLSDKLKEGGNLQQLAREERYAFFKEHLDGTPQSRLLVAHHQDDQYETFWLQLKRGAGMAGLKGMLPENGRILRPLLSYSRQELSTYAHAISLSWREDVSNQKTMYLRNALRLKILPALEKEVPTLRHSVLYIQELFHAQLVDFESTLQALLKEIKKNDIIHLDEINHLVDFHIIELLKGLEIPPAHHLGFTTLLSAEKGKKITWDATSGVYHEVVRERTHLRFVRRTENLQAPPCFQVEKVNELPTHFSKDVLFLDALRLKGVLHVRPWKNADRMQPIGLNGSKLISDILKDAHVQHSEKKQQFLLCDDEKILACIGHCIDRRAIATPTSVEILRIDFNNNW